MVYLKARHRYIWFTTRKGNIGSCDLSAVEMNYRLVESGVKFLLKTVFIKPLLQWRIGSHRSRNFWWLFGYLNGFEVKGCQLQSWDLVNSYNFVYNLSSSYLIWKRFDFLWKVTKQMCGKLLPAIYHQIQIVTQLVAILQPSNSDQFPSHTSS